MANLSENEFEQRLAVALKLLLPTFHDTDISSQRSFRLKFGHHDQVVGTKTSADDKRKYSKGTYDVLLSIKGKPLVMLELKKPGTALELPKDRDQGVSYARLTDPITPVTIITNGSEFKVYDTFTKNDISDSVLDDQFFSQRLDQLSDLAKNDYREAIVTLIEGDQQILFDLFNRISEDTFERLTSDIDDVKKPIVRNFSVIRDLLGTLEKTLKDKQFVVVTGDAYVGKTNLLHQFFQRKKAAGDAVLYVNCLDFHYSVFRKLTNHLHNILRFPVDELKLKDWLLLQFGQGAARKLTLIFDHVRHNIDQSIMNDISEVVDIFRMNGCQVIIATDHSNFQLLRRNADRVMNTMIGDYFFELVLEKFTTTEYYAANELAYDNYEMTFAWGSVYSDVYRLPRLWRVLLTSERAGKPEGHYGLFKAVPGMEFLEVLQNGWQLDRELIGDFVKLIDTFMDGISRSKSGKSKLMMRSLGIIYEDSAIKLLGEQKINRLIYAGFLERRSVEGFEWVLVPKLPELLAGHSRLRIFERYYSAMQNNFENGYRQLIDECEFFPYGELVACRFIMDLVEHNELDLFSDTVNHLLRDEPKSETTTDAKSVAIYVQKIGQVNIDFEEGVETSFIGNGFPWLVLSHVLCLNIGDDSTEPHRFRLSMISGLADRDYIIRKADNTFFHDGIPSFQLGRLGEVLQTNIGIVEPITQALHLNLLGFPELIEEYALWAKEEKMFRLLNRLYIAARNAVTMDMTDERSGPVCEKLIADYEKDFPEMLAFALAENENDPEEIRTLTERLRKLKSK